MRLIHAGDPWWLGKPVYCDECYAIYELERGDQGFGYRVIDAGSFKEVMFTCPECGADMLIRKRMKQAPVV